MCLQCDGYSEEEAWRSLDLTIRVHGWALVQVADDDEAWGYTVGLLESYGHPELIAMDLAADAQHRLISTLVEMIRTTGSLDPTALERLGVTTGAVHPDHSSSELVAQWANIYGHLPPPGSYVQVFAPPCWYCECHRDAVRRLDRPGSLPPHRS